MTIYKRSEFLFKEQEQLLLTKDLGSYGNLDTGDWKMRDWLQSGGVWEMEDC